MLWKDYKKQKNTNGNIDFEINDIKSAISRFESMIFKKTYFEKCDIVEEYLEKLKEISPSLFSIIRMTEIYSILKGEKDEDIDCDNVLLGRFLKSLKVLILSYNSFNQKNIYYLFFEELLKKIAELILEDYQECYFEDFEIYSFDLISVDDINDLNDDFVNTIWEYVIDMFIEEDTIITNQNLFIDFIIKYLNLIKKMWEQVKLLNKKKIEEDYFEDYVDFHYTCYKSIKNLCVLLKCFNINKEVVVEFYGICIDILKCVNLIKGWECEENDFGKECWSIVIGLSDHAILLNNRKMAEIYSEIQTIHNADNHFVEARNKIFNSQMEEELFYCNCIKDMYRYY